MIRILEFLLVCFFLAWASASSNETRGKVVTILDGNTIEILTEENETHKIVLAGIDCPELKQDFGERARLYLHRLICKKEVDVTFQGKDKKGNYLAIVLLKDGTDPRIELLKEGLAWTSEKDSLPALEIHRAMAQQNGKGLWIESNPIPPWIYRRQQSMLQPKSR